MIHVAVLLKPYLSLILAGRKTVECRLTRQAREPFESIEAGERIYFKQSSGPYAATAVADHVMCEGGLTPRRVDELRRDYNGMILGEPAYWKAKRQSRCATLVWLRDVEPIDHGPLIRPLQGVAWLCLEEDSAWRRMERRPSGEEPLHRSEPFSVMITAGNLRNSTLYVTAVMDRLPPWCVGGATKETAARPVCLMLHQGPVVDTDVVGPRKLIRARVWGDWFRRNNAREGDHVVFFPQAEGTYRVGLWRPETSGRR